MLCVVAAGCTQRAKDKKSFDQILASNRIDQISVLAEAADGSVFTSSLAGEGVKATLISFTASNRIDTRLWKKSYAKVVISLVEDNKPRGSVQWFTDEQVWAFGFYQFRLRDTNALPNFLSLPRN
jgi:hypothetical protein